MKGYSPAPVQEGFSVDRLTEAGLSPEKMKESLFPNNDNGKPVPLFTLKGLGDKINTTKIASQQALENFGNDMRDRAAAIPHAL